MNISLLITDCGLPMLDLPFVTTDSLPSSLEWPRLLTLLAVLALTVFTTRILAIL